VAWCDGRLELDAAWDLAPEAIPPIERAVAAQLRMHRIGARCYCGRPWCPICGGYGSPSHKRRADRLADQVGNVRLGKWIITMSEEDRAFIEGREDIEQMMGQVAAVIMRCHAVPAAKIAVHWMGDLTQGVHYEGVFPHDGRRESKRDLVLFRKELAIALDLQGLPEAKFIFVDHDEDPVVQWRMNRQRTRYMMHPTIPSWRLLELGDGELRALVEMRTRFETCRGYGLWSKTKVRTPTAAALARAYPMPPTQEEEKPRGWLHAGEPCPGRVAPGEDCGSTIAQNQGIRPARPGGTEIAPGVFVHEFTVSLSDVPAAIDHARGRCQPIFWRDVGEDGKNTFRPAEDLPHYPGAQRPMFSTKDPRFVAEIAKLSPIARDPGEDLMDADVYVPEGRERRRHAKLVRWMIEEEWRSRWRHVDVSGYAGIPVSARVQDLGDVGRAWDAALWNLFSMIKRKAPGASGDTPPGARRRLDDATMEYG
jgi:hypothetical protein